jgi:hypothetical protein
MESSRLEADVAGTTAPQDARTTGMDGEGDMAQNYGVGQIDGLTFITPEGLYDPRPNAYRVLVGAAG